MRLQGFFRIAHLALWSAGVIVCGGCVAMNIPSQRHHDPADRGGMFGDFRDGSGGVGYGTESIDVHPSGCAGGGHCGDFDADDAWDSDGRRKEKPPEIPWPRYHPVPTRPVFGPAG